MFTKKRLKFPFFLLLFKTHVEKVLRQSSISSLTDKKPSNKTVSDAIEIADLGNFSDDSEDLSVVDEESDVDSTDDE